VAVTDISDKVLDAALARLAHATTGLNATWAAYAPTKGIPASLINFDFTIDSQSFFLAQLDPDLLEQTGIIKYPCAYMYIPQSAHAGLQKFNKFSGAVQLVLELYLSWKDIKGNKLHFARYSNAVEAVVIDIFNRVENQDWGKPLVYNGMIKCRRGPLKFAGENWRQLVGFSLEFELHE
jgi:hypothetical protein